MKTRKLQLACPVCGSADVFYSCSPACCFNHVCAGCGATFEPATSVRPGGPVAVTPPDPLPEASDPTAACARCDSTRVYSLESGGGAVCAACGARLEIAYTEVSAA